MCTANQERWFENVSTVHKTLVKVRRKRPNSKLYKYLAWILTDSNNVFITIQVQKIIKCPKKFIY